MTKNSKDLYELFKKSNNGEEKKRTNPDIPHSRIGWNDTTDMLVFN